MAKAPNQTTINHILIALDASLKDLATLELAATLAARKQAKLMTLFIEDQNLLHFASLPFALEIDPTSRRERKIDSFQMERALRTQAQQVKRTLKRITEELQVEYSAKVVRGSYMNEVFSATSGVDIIFLKRGVGHFKTHTKIQHPHLRHLSSEQHSVNDAVWVVYNDSSYSNRVLSMACDLALEKGRELIVILQTDDPKQAQHKERQVASIIKDRIDHAHFIVTPNLTDPALLNMLQSKACGLLVMHRKKTIESDKLAQKFLEELDCPLVLVL